MTPHLNERLLPRIEWQGCAVMGMSKFRWRLSDRVNEKFAGDDWTFAAEGGLAT
ncbi:MAG: hypothetical protein Q4P24_09730 [Rhodobacterales bacterium]|nr:hypothetical protein [Rhodobacterales bacterium]